MARESFWEALSVIFGALFILAIVLGFFLFIPWLVFWSVKILFNYHIPFSFKSALAFWIFFFFLKAVISIQINFTAR